MFFKKKRDFFKGLWKQVQDTSLINCFQAYKSRRCICGGGCDFVFLLIIAELERLKNKLPKSIILPRFSHLPSVLYIRKCSSKKVFLKILQYSQENTCAGVSF